MMYFHSLYLVNPSIIWEDSIGKHLFQFIFLLYLIIVLNNFKLLELEREFSKSNFYFLIELHPNFCCYLLNFDCLFEVNLSFINSCWSPLGIYLTSFKGLKLFIGIGHLFDLFDLSIVEWYYLIEYFDWIEIRNHLFIIVICYSWQVIL